MDGMLAQEMASKNGVSSGVTQVEALSRGIFFPGRMC
jgi:hypothetical protein